MKETEKIVGEALRRSGRRYVTENHPSNTARLDFYLPDEDVYVEVKSFHSPRIGPQMGRAANVIAIQGMAAARLFAEMITKEPLDAGRPV